jgi:ketosteroid isomerase-like protein
VWADHTTSEVNDMTDPETFDSTHPDTAEVIKQFNDAFLQRDPTMLVDLVAEDCLMESAQPAPNGISYKGYDACLQFWQELIADPNGSFQPEEVVVSGDRATIRWRYRFGEGDENSVRGVTLMHVRDGKIVEALGYVKAALRP